MGSCYLETARGYEKGGDLEGDGGGELAVGGLEDDTREGRWRVAGDVVGPTTIRTDLVDEGPAVGVAVDAFDVSCVHVGTGAEQDLEDAAVVASERARERRLSPATVTVIMMIHLGARRDQSVDARRVSTA